LSYVIDMDKKSVKELKELAKAKKIRGYNTMKKADLINALSGKKPELSPAIQKALARDKERRAKAKAEEEKKKEKPKKAEDKPPPVAKRPKRKEGETKGDYLLRVAKANPKKPLPTPTPKKKLLEKVKTKEKPKKKAPTLDEMIEKKWDEHKKNRVKPTKVGGNGGVPQPKKKGRKVFKPSTKSAREEGEVPKKQPNFRKPRKPSYDPTGFKIPDEFKGEDTRSAGDKILISIEDDGVEQDHSGALLSLEEWFEDTSGRYPTDDRGDKLKYFPTESIDDFNEREMYENLDNLASSGYSYEAYTSIYGGVPTSMIAPKFSIKSAEEQKKRKKFVKKAPYTDPRQTDLNKKGKATELISRDNRRPVEPNISISYSDFPKGAMVKATPKEVPKLKPKPKPKKGANTLVGADSRKASSNMNLVRYPKQSAYSQTAIPQNYQDIKKAVPRFVPQPPMSEAEIEYRQDINEVSTLLANDLKRDREQLKQALSSGIYENPIDPTAPQGTGLSKSLKPQMLKKKGRGEKGKAVPVSAVIPLKYGDNFGQEYQRGKNYPEPMPEFAGVLRETATHNRKLAEKGKKPIGSKKTDTSGGNQLHPDFRRGAKRTGYTDYRTFQASKQEEGDFFGESDLIEGEEKEPEITIPVPENEGGLIPAQDIIGLPKKGKRTYPKPTKKDLVEKKGANPFVRGGKERKLTGKFATSGKVRREKDYKPPDEEEKKKGAKKVVFSKNVKKQTKVKDQREKVPVPKEIFRSAQSTLGRDRKKESKMTDGKATEAQKAKLNTGLLKGIERAKARKEGKKVEDTNESVFTKKGKQEFADKYTRKGVPKEVIKRFLAEEVKSSPDTKYKTKEEAFDKMFKKLSKSLSTSGEEKSKAKEDKYIKERKALQDKFATALKTLQEKMKTGTAGENRKTSTQITKKRQRLDINLKKLAEKYGK